MSPDLKGWRSNDAVHLIGLPKTREKQKGSLSIVPDALMFTSPEGQAAVQLSEISNVTVGDVNVETGGTAGKVTRAIIPFGGGAAIATVTHKQFSLLTVEFYDQSNAFHGAVFLLPKDEAVLAQKQLLQRTSPIPVERPRKQCETKDDALPSAIKLAAITNQGDPVPEEYTVLLYEQLVRRLREEGTFTAVYRTGDDDAVAACSRYELDLTLTGFKKGSAAVRASTGPVGFFVGATRLKVHVKVQDSNGKTLLDKYLQASQRGDTDSLNVADKIAKSLAKDLKKVSVNAAGI